MGKEDIQQIVFGAEIAEIRFEHSANLFDAIAKLLESGQHQAALNLSKLGREIAREGADDIGELCGSTELEGGKQ